jgi:POT family proton-dependent oligopeptide transporter
MNKRTAFPPVFWVANSIEIFERFAYYGIYMGFGIYLEHLGYSKGDLGFIQTVFLGFSYLIPLFSGTFADKYGFKKMLIVSYLAYLPSILLLIVTKSFSGIALTMLTIGFAAGIFKPLVSATVRATTDSTNKTVGFGIFYMMVNVGASFGPLVMGKLRAMSWDYVFYTAAATIGIMFLITVFFYKEPKREIEGISLSQKFKDIITAFSDGKFALFIFLLGIFFWLPFWAFFNVLAVYVNDFMNTAGLYNSVKSILGTGITNILSRQEGGIWKINAEAISHDGYIIIIFQVLISKIFEKRPALPSFMFGLFVAAIGFIILGIAVIGPNALVFLGIFLFAIGEMISSPRIQEYIMWIAPKEKAGLYMGTSFLATFIGAFLSGIVYTGMLGTFQEMGHPEYTMYTLAAHLIVGIIVIYIFTKTLGEFKELEEYDTDK